MLTYIVYLIMGVLVGILIKYEIDIRIKRKRAKRRIVHLQNKTSQTRLKQYDDILQSVRGINESLSSMNKNDHQKEV